jgi:hypothetical protein
LTGRVGGLLLWVAGFWIGMVRLHGGVMGEAVGQEVDCFDAGVFFGGLAVVHGEIILRVTLLSTMLDLGYGAMRGVFFISF